MKSPAAVLCALALVSGASVPDARPPVASRKFQSPAVEAKISEIRKLITDPDLSMMFANTFPSTLDTTVAWTDLVSQPPKSFVITGDIPAMWLRDSMNQVIHYVPLMKDDANLEKLILGVINLQAEYVKYFPYGNAFKAPKESLIVSGTNSWAKNDVVSPRPEDDSAFDDIVWESKYELDSLAAFLRLATTWYENASDKSALKNGPFVAAVKRAVDTMIFMQTGSAEQAWRDDVNKQKYVFRRLADSPTETCFVGGEGNRAKRTGMVRSGFRPADDACLYPFLVPSNMMTYTALAKLYCIATDIGIDTDTKAKIGKLANDIESGIANYAVVNVPLGKASDTPKKIFAYEVSGYPGQYNVMDDANVPSLLSIPDLGYLVKSETCDLPIKTPSLSLADRKSIYADTRAVILSAESNAWYFERFDPKTSKKSAGIEGIGGPHTGLERVWPMAIAMRALTADVKTEADSIKEQLNHLLDAQASTGLMHEGVDPRDPAAYSRQWFAWANTVFGQLILELAKSTEGKAILKSFTYKSKYSN